jgi:hypothetical protein
MSESKCPLFIALLDTIITYSLMLVKIFNSLSFSHLVSVSYECIHMDQVL